MGVCIHILTLPHNPVQVTTGKKNKYDSPESALENGLIFVGVNRVGVTEGYIYIYMYVCIYIFECVGSPGALVGLPRRSGHSCRPLLRLRFGIYKTFIYFKAVVHESTILAFLRPPALLTLVEYYCTIVGQYTTPLPTSRLHAYTT